MLHLTGFHPISRRLLTLSLFTLGAGIWLSACNGCARAGNAGGGTADGAARDSTGQERALPAESELAYIEKFVGRRPAEVNLWESEPLQSKLKELLGRDYHMYLESMLEAGPLTRDGIIYTVGTVPDDAVPGVAYLLVDTVEGHLKAYAVYGDLVIEAETPGSTWVVPEKVAKRIVDALNI